jgi:hypothetical protein
MDDAQLKRELEARIRQRYDQVREHSGDSHSVLAKLTDAEWNGMIQAEVDKTFPFLKQVREESGEVGEFTERQYHLAGNKLCASERNLLIAKIEEASERAENPHKQVIMMKFVENIKADAEDMKVFEKEDLTEEELHQVTQNIVERSIDLLRFMKYD